MYVIRTSNSGANFKHREKKKEEKRVKRERIEEKAI